MELKKKCNIDKVFLINMKRRKDRKILMEYKLKEMNIDYEIIEGIDGKLEKNLENYNKYLKNWENLDKNKEDNIYRYKVNSPGAYGLLLTYKKIIEIVKKEKLNNILILEDDITFHKDFYKLLNNYQDKVFTDNDVILLGGNQSKFTDKMLKDMKEKNYYYFSKENYEWTYGAYSVIINNKVINYIEKVVEDIHSPYLLNIDILIWNLNRIKNLNSIVLYENLIIPQVEESDNMGHRSIKDIASQKKWIISNYNYFTLTSLFNNIYQGVLYDNFSLRDSSVNVDTSLDNKSISKLIEGNNKTFVFIIPSYNNIKWYKWNLDSIFNQVYPYWRIIYIDDASTDNTKHMVEKYVVNKGYKNKFKMIEKKENTKQAHSRMLAYKECQDDEICCMLDGDDALFDDKMLLYKLNKMYIDNNLLISYGQFYYVDNYVLENLSGRLSYTEEDIKNNDYRDKWVTQHLRTCEASLLKQIPEEYMKFQGEWLKCCTDVAEMWWVLEKSEGRHMNVGFPTCYYNKTASIQSNFSYYNKDNKKNKKEKKYREDVMYYLRTYQGNKIIELN